MDGLVDHQAFELVRLQPINCYQCSSDLLLEEADRQVLDKKLQTATRIGKLALLILGPYFLISMLATLVTAVAILAARGDRAGVLPGPAVSGEIGDPVAGAARGAAYRSAPSPAGRARAAGDRAYVAGSIGPLGIRITKPNASAPASSASARNASSPPSPSPHDRSAAPPG